MKKDVKNINSDSVFHENEEFYVSVRTKIDSGEYPQAHDFFEIIIVTRGTMTVLLNNDTFELHSGDFLLICPGDVHTKTETGPSTHLNLAFPTVAMDCLVQYLYGPQCNWQSGSFSFHKQVVHLSEEKLDEIQKRLNFMNRFPYACTDKKNTHFRVLMLDLIYTQILAVNQQQTDSTSEMPAWLLYALNEQCSNISYLVQGMEYLTQQTGRSGEHICRCFRKYLDTTPSAYINEKRLIYSANLLLQTDMEIVDIIYECGFQSVNYYYHLFKQKFGVSPLKYKNRHKRPNL